MFHLVRVLGARFSRGALVTSGLWALLCRRLLTLSGATDLSLAGLMHALQLVLLVVTNVAAESSVAAHGDEGAGATAGVEHVSASANARATMVATHDLASILSGMVQQEYLTRILTWPPQYGAAPAAFSRSAPHSLPSLFLALRARACLVLCSTVDWGL